ncbi:MAG: CDP-diacylglycerol--serine O-phosphatidyltransferase [Flammeovirgaceae bacterium]|nr:CDP-diacylglycerol--serine O-phosphatidyltransferase [Flammeovirgaceae bacterium]
MTRHLPNLLTICNLLCGVFGIVHLLQANTIPAAYFIWAACIFDFLDGFVARVLKVQSPIGKELDSLADVVSFGVLPSLVMYVMLSHATDYPYVPYLAFSIAAFSAIRLAIFNTDETQHESFRGLPTPANALFISSIPLLTGTIASWILQEWVLVLIALLFSYLLVSPVELFALKFKKLQWKDNQVKFTFVLVSVLLIGIFRLSAIPLIILLYIITSLLFKKLLR